jgi:integrase
MERVVSRKRKKPRVLGVTRRGEPYLWLRDGRIGSDGNERGALWVILHRGKQVRSTGCSANEGEAALQALADYKAEIARPGAVRKNRPADEVLVADALSRYLQVKEPLVARGEELAQRVTTLLEWWGERTLADIDRVTCGEYVASRVGTPWKAHARLGTGASGKPARRGHSKPPKARVVTEGGARRELEDLRAAVNMAIGDGLTREIVKVTLPGKSAPRDRWLTKKEAAGLVMRAWRKKEIQKGVVTDRHCARHLARYLVVALRSGTRSGAVCSASFIPEIGRSWIELGRDDHDRPTAKFHRLALGQKEKGNKRYPTVPLPSQLAAQLWRWHHVDGQRYVVEWNGKPVKTTKRAFANLCYEMGFGDDVVRHSLRHTAATWGMQAGVPVAELAGYLGMSTQTLERTYGHHSPDHMEEAKAAMGGKRRKAA